MRYTLHHFEIEQGDPGYGIITPFGRVVTTGIDERHGWLEAKDGIRYRSQTHSTINNTKSVTVSVALPEQHPLFNNNLIIRICRSDAHAAVGYRPGVVAGILDLIADAVYNAGVPYEYEAYPQQ